MFFLSQFKLVDANENDPAFTTLLNEFATKTKRGDLKDKLEPFFSILKQSEVDNLKDRIELKNLFDIENELKIFTNNKNFSHFCKKIQKILSPVNENHKTIGNCYTSLCNMLSEPKVWQLDGLEDALKDFKKKAINKNHLKKISDELIINMPTRYNYLYKQLAGSLETLKTTKIDYIKRINLVRQDIEKLEKLKYDEIKAHLNKLQTSVNELIEKQKKMSGAAKMVEIHLNQYNSQRVSWAESLLNAKLYDNIAEKTNSCWRKIC